MNFQHDLQQGMSPYKKQAIECFHTLVGFLKNPVEGIKNLPNWDWPTLVAFHLALSAACGLMGGILSIRLGRIFSGLIVFPLSSLFIAALLTGFFYYTLLFVFHRETDFKKLATLVIFANIPFLFLSIFDYYLTPIVVFAILASGMLLIVGLTELTQLPRRKITQWIGGMMAIYVAFWIYGAISSSYEGRATKDLATPESLDILEEELGTSE